MKEIIDLIRHVMYAEKTHGKYIGLLLLALLFLWMAPKEFSGRRGKKLALFTVVLICFVFCVPFLYLIFRTTGFGQNFWEYLWTVPALAVIAYVAVELCMMQKSRASFLGTLGACLIGIALSGTVLPFKGEVEKWKYADQNVETVLATVSAQKDLYGGELLLLAPDEILERARAYDGGIRLVYGKDMWDVRANTAVADDYPQDIRLLYEKMQRDYEYPDEVADCAKWYGCDVLVLREKLSQGSTQGKEWKLVREIPGYIVYRYVGME
ncbi:MAG: hypothetical protein GX234_06555 [Clostridiales bacterium]|nr:hypothetical protein [Clostridiales bacterium]